MVHNLVPVTLGSVVSGALLMGVAYWFVEGPADESATPSNDAVAVTSDD